MSAERIRQLHEQATERYLNEDYPGALQAWRDILGLDPTDEQALGGVRLASKFVEQTSPLSSPEMSTVEHELDQGLMVLDGLLGGTTRAHPETVTPTMDRWPEAERIGETDRPDILQGWDSLKESPVEEDSFGLEPITRSSPAAAPARAPAPAPAPTPTPTPGLSAAAAELGRRVKDLLGEARAKAEAGERDEALAILARLAILDEDNEEAAELRADMESASSAVTDKVESAIIEGVAALEADRLDDAERFLREALALAPEHREALHYLDKVTERRACGGEELLSVVGREAAPTPNAVPDATPVETAPRKRAPEPVEAPRPTEPPRKAPRVTLPPPKFLIGAGVGVVVLAGAVIAWPHLFGHSGPEKATKTAAAPTPRPKRPAKPAAPANGEARAVPASPEDAARLIASGLAKGRAFVASGDFGSAVIAFNEALAIDPKNAEARAGLEDAGALYKANKAEREALNTIGLAFRDGEYTSALRLAYRLPPSVAKSYTDAIKVAGWYNLAVVALRAGECREAISHIDEALEISPAAVEATKLREFASRYLNAVKDRAFLDRVEALSFLPMPKS